MEDFMDEERADRQKRIHKRFQALYGWMNRPVMQQTLFDKNGPPPSLSKSELLEFMKDLKEEGNIVFKEKQYKSACEFYTQSLMAAEVLQAHFNNEDDSVFISAVFSNRATCYYKMGQYSKAAEDSDNALYLYPHNIKAFYRNACAHRELGNIGKALHMAEQGAATAFFQDRRLDMKDFVEIIHELEQIRDASHRRMKQTQEKAESDKQGKDGKDVDLSWVEGTSALQQRRPQPVKSKKKKKNRNKAASSQVTTSERDDAASNGPRVEYQGRYAAITQDESDENEEDEGDQEEEAEEEEEVEGDKDQAAGGESWAPQVPDDLSLGYLPNAEYNHGASVSKSESTNWQSKGGTSKNRRSEPEETATPTQAVKDFPVFQPPSPPGYPFDSQYDFTLVCNRCYKRVGYGPNGLQAQPDLAHLCEANVLLVRPKNNKNAPWVKIRPRNNPTHLGRFILCNTYTANQSCHSEEARCSFAHYQEEILMWTLDRDGTISIKGFIHRQRDFLIQGQMRKIYPGATPQPKTVAGKKKTPAGSTVHQTRPATGPPPLKAQHPQLRLEPWPLAKTHRFVLACTSCARPSAVPSIYQHTGIHANCRQEWLLASALRVPSASGWALVRERVNHRPFYGKYVQCRYVNAPKHPGNLMTCSFAHNRIEQELWALEKDGIFQIQEFILSNRTGGGEATKFSVTELFRRHPGDFAVLCRQCFESRPSMLSTQGQKNASTCSNPRTRHPWSAQNKQLVFLSQKDSNMIINTVLEKPNILHFQICNYGDMCVKRGAGHCPKAHSTVERDFWLLERDSRLSRDQIVFEFNRLKTEAETSPSPVGSGRTTPAARASRPATPSGQVGGAASTIGLSCSAGAPKPSGPPRPPFQMSEVCQMCWKSGQRSVQDKKNQDRCTGRGMGHQWTIHKICVVISKNKATPLRTMPQGTNTARGSAFQLCPRIQERKKCPYNDRCTFAHSPEELKTWNYMILCKVKNYEEVVNICRKFIEEDKKAKTIEKGQSIVTAQPVAPGSQQIKRPILSPLDLATIMYHCQYCSVVCNSQKQWDEHCASNNHLFNVNSDKEHQWNFRQPPWVVTNGVHQLCQKHAEGEQCRYSLGLEQHNLCPYAHSQEELDEWQERWRWRQLKLDMARRGKVFSYMQQMMEEYEKSDAPVTVLADDVKGAVAISEQDCSVYLDRKDATFLWRFEVQTHRPLEKVALLMNADRLHFSLRLPGTSGNAQITSGDSLTYTREGSTYLYQLEVEFRGGLFGSFAQWVVFDTGERPALIRRLNVDLGAKQLQEVVQTLREQLTFDRWTRENREIIRFAASANNAGKAGDFSNGDIGDADDEIGDTFDDELLRQYRAPSSADEVVTQKTVAVALNENNYVHKMHSLLKLEELTCARIIAKYNLKVEIEVFSTIREGALINARAGELFAKVPLGDNLSEDSDAGKLILSSVQRVLLAPQDSDCNAVYEAIILNKENYDYDGKGKDYIYLCLSTACVRDLKLASGESLRIEIQFQMERLPFCKRHFAVDQLPNTDNIFPDIGKINASYNIQRFKISSDRLNEDQLLIVKHLIAEKAGYLPPLIVYGPFGTGKTETIAQAAMLLLQHRKDARILICTHSNSAADLFITNHLDAFISTKKSKGFKLLRIYFQERRKSTVSPTVLQYCLLTPDGTGFRPPNLRDVQDVHVVVTTFSTSLSLTKVGLPKGYFTHMLLDEAAQALECETIMPLSLAGPTTCVLLAGDHMEKPLLSPRHISRAQSTYQYFTHILLDEAAQALECETIMPLSLAGPATCVLLAGDHMQMGPKVYSQQAQQQKFDRSFLERLYIHYERFQSILPQDRPLKLLLRKNYRSNKEILRFISVSTYHVPLEPCSRQPDVALLVPLTFYVAQGQEVQQEDSTSYYNQAEVREIVSRVEELYDSWPTDEWGPRRPEMIAVVTPYFDQVSRIRQALRRHRQDLRGIIVERIMNMQGREFRALFISTVRTRHLASAKSGTAMANNMATDVATDECDGVGGDYGFLSDQKLLNTALTRAMSFVAVVGDPVALCTLGSCSNVWRAFLKHCSQLGGLYTLNLDVGDPVALCTLGSCYNVWRLFLKHCSQLGGLYTLTLEDIKQKVDEFSMSAQGTRAISAAANNTGSPQGGARSGGLGSLAQAPNLPTAPVFEYAAVLKGQGRKVASIPQARAVSLREPPKPESPTKVSEPEFLSISEARALGLSATDLLRQLAYDVTSVELPSTAARGARSKISRVEQIDLKWLSIKEEDGRAILSYDDVPSGDLDDSDDLDTSFGDGINEQILAVTGRAIDQSPSQLRDKLKSNLFKYKHCVLCVESDMNMHAKVLEGSSQVQRILLATHARCGVRAQPGDEVLVEVLHENRATTDPTPGPGGNVTPSGNEAEYTPHGHVLGVMYTHAPLEDRWLVCAVNPENTGELLPLNSDAPLRVYNLETRARAQRASDKRLVTLYSVARAERAVRFHRHQTLPALLGVAGAGGEGRARGESALVVVRVLRWEPELQAPVGIAMASIAEGSTHENALQLLHTMYQVPPAFSPEMLRIVHQDIPPDFKIQEQHIKQRLDFRKSESFTMENGHRLGEGSEGDAHGVAYSFDKLEDGQFLIGVHVVDISFFVKRKKPIDLEASNRGVHFVDAEGSTTPIFPDSVMQNVLALRPDQDRLTFTLFFQIDRTANIVKVTPKKSVLRSRRHFSLGEIQNVLQKGKSSGFEDDIEMSLFGLARVAQVWRKRRLGSDALFPDADTPPAEIDARSLSNELELVTNRYVAEQLQSMFSECAPLLIQRAPPEQSLARWRRRHAATVWGTHGLTRHFKALGEICSCEDVCECLPLEEELLPPVLVESNAWAEVRNCLVSGNAANIHSVLADISTRPQVEVAWRELAQLLGNAHFRPACDLADDQSAVCHYSNNLTAYTSFTRPLTSYIDSAVHRMLIAGLQNKPCPYTAQEVATLCVKANDAAFRASEFGRRSRAFQFGANLRTQPLCFYPLLEHVTNEHVTLRFPQCLAAMLPSMSLPLSALAFPGAVVHTNSQQFSVHMPLKLLSADGDMPCDGWWPRFRSIPALEWQALLVAAKKGKPRATLDAATVANEKLGDIDNKTLVRTSPDTVQISLDTGSVVRVQLSATMQRGLLQPAVQIFAPCPGLDVCVEHRSDPLKCFLDFVGNEDEPLSKRSYPDIEAYQNAWLDGLAIETCQNVLDTVSPVVVSGLQCTWFSTDDGSGLDRFAAYIRLPLEFCVQNNLTFALDEHTIESLMMLRNYESFGYASDNERAYVCLRHPNVPVHTGHAQVLSKRGAYTWVAHCVFNKVTVQDGVVGLQLQLIHSAVQLPKSLINQTVSATMEVLEKPNKFRVLEKALHAISNAGQLCHDILLHQEPQPLGSLHMTLVSRLGRAPATAPPLDEFQAFAERKALTQPFTVIQGVAGSGKSMIAASLAFKFAQLNKMSSVNADRNVVLMCAPSQHALQVNLRLLRFYPELRVQAYGAVDFDYTNCDVILCTPEHALGVRRYTNKSVAQIIIDNSQECLEPELAVPLAYFSPSHVVLLGDLSQCGPRVRSQRARLLGLGTSLMQRYSDSAVILTRHYRMHNGIAAPLAGAVYQAFLQPVDMEQIRASPLRIWPSANRQKPSVFLSLSSALVQYETHPALVSHPYEGAFNQDEVLQVCRLVTMLVRRLHLPPENVAVLSAHPAQCRRLRLALDAKDEPRVTVCSVYECAGNQWDYVIVSCVSSVLPAHIEPRPSAEWRDRHLGPIEDSGVVTTMLTRARRGLIIIGNNHLLKLSPVWSSLLKYFVNEQQIMEASDFAK